jgi:superoxide dismutase, Fe-Mn family
MLTLPKLPYAEDALEPYVSAETMALHHGKHHKAYVAKLNELLVGDPLADVPLEDVIRKSHGLAARQHIFDNAAQCWNHDFFWKSMTPGGGGASGGAIKDMISRDIGDKKAFSEAFVKAASDHFGSGWIWLVLNGDSVEIMTTHDADLPLVHGRIALVACDLWEHAYYVDYQNKRPEFVDAFLDHLINWDFANANLDSATADMARAA